MEQVQYITIGDEYAKRLGYEELVGSMAIVDNVLEALVGVTVISGAPGFVGKQLDIHKADAILLQEEASEKLYAVADFLKGVIYYSRNLEFAEKCANIIGFNRTQVFRDSHHIHEVLDELFKKFPYQRELTMHGYKDMPDKPMNWMAYDLDDESCEETAALRNSYQYTMENEQRREKRRVEMEVEKTNKVKSLTDSFKSQLTSHLEGPGIHVDWNPDDDAADTLDSKSEDYDTSHERFMDPDDGLMGC